MFSRNSYLYVSSMIVLSFDFMPAVPGVSGDSKTSANCKEPNVTSQKAENYHFVPAGVGSVNWTEGQFTDKMKELFSGNDEELLCNVTLKEELMAIPNITCEGAFSQALNDSLRKLKTNYSDEGAQNRILDLVWQSKVGNKTLTLISGGIFGNESNAKARVQEMWFKKEGAYFLSLFPDVFLGYETQEEFKGVNASNFSDVANVNDSVNCQNVNVTYVEEEDEEEGDDEGEFDNFPVDAAPVSWTGNFFRQIEGDLNITKGYTQPLVNESMYLASIEAELGGVNRSSAFVVGTTFLHDFISYTMCWLYGVKLDKCIIPLPGNTTVMIEITNITSESQRPNNDNVNNDVYISCIGFKVNMTVN